MPDKANWKKQLDKSSGSYALLIVFLLLFLPSFSFALETKTVSGTTLKLISNTGQCLIDCEAWMEWDLSASPTVVSVSSVPSSQFNFEVTKSIGAKGLLDFGIEVWEEKDVIVIDYCQNTKEILVDDKNESLKCGQASCPVQDLVTEECGSHVEKQWQKISDSIYGFKALQQKYRLRIWGKKIAGLNNDVDWIPTILGTKIGEWAWWNASYSYKKAINNLNVTADLNGNDLIRLENINFSALSLQCVDLNDLRVVDETANEELKRITEGDRGTVDGNVVFKLNTNLATGVYSSRFYLYYNNAACPAPDTHIWQDFNTLNEFAAVSTTGGTASMVNLAKTAVAKKSYSTLKYVTDGSDDDATIDYRTDDSFSDTNVGFWLYSTNISATSNNMHVYIDDLDNYTNGGGAGGRDFVITGDGIDCVVVNLTTSTWFYFIFERKSATSVNAYAFNSAGALQGSYIGCPIVSGRWDIPAKMRFSSMDREAFPITSYFDEIRTQVPDFPAENNYSYLLGSQESQATIADINVVKTDGTTIVPYLHYSYVSDGNLSITVSIQLTDNNRATLDLNYNTTQAQGGTIIVKDLNLTSHECASLDWAVNPVECTWDWNISKTLVADGNYFIVGRLTNQVKGDVDVNYSDFAIRISNDFNLVVNNPIDISTGATIDVSKYGWNVNVNDVNYYPNNTDRNGFAVERALGNITIHVDTNSIDYFATDYVISANPSSLSYTLTPYLTRRKVDVNVTLIEGVPFDVNLSFSDFVDGNLTITVSVQNNDNNRISLDLNYSVFYGDQNVSNTIVKDLNLNSTCASLDWQTTPTTCTWDWNVAGITDGNYYITAKARSMFNGTAILTDFNHSNNQIIIANDFNLIILTPKDEETGQAIDTASKYRWTVRIWDTSGMRYYQNQIDTNGFLVIKGGTNVVVEIDTNSTDYYSRIYSIPIAGIGATYTLQPYLTKQNVSGNFIFNVTNLTSAAPIANVTIKIFGFIPDMGLQGLQTVVTDAAGLATIPLRLDAPYTVEFWYNGELVLSDTITPTAASLYYQVQLNIPGTQEQPIEVGAIHVDFFPETLYLLQKPSGTIDINVSVWMYVKEIQQIRLRVLDTNGCRFKDSVFNAPWTDGNTVYMPNIDLNGGIPKNIYNGLDCNFSTQFDIYVLVDVNSTDANKFSTVSIHWKLLQADNYNYNILYLLTNLGTSLNGNNGKLATTFIAFLVLLAAVSAVGAVTGGSPIPAALMTLAILGFFVIIGFVDLFPFIVISLATFFTTIYLWSRFG